MSLFESKNSPPYHHETQDIYRYRGNVSSTGFSPHPVLLLSPMIALLKRTAVGGQGTCRNWEVTIIYALQIATRLELGDGRREEGGGG